MVQNTNNARKQYRVCKNKHHKNRRSLIFLENTEPWGCIFHCVVDLTNPGLAAYSLGCNPARGHLMPGVQLDRGTGPIR